MSEKPIEGQYGVYTKDGWKIIQDLPEVLQQAPKKTCQSDTSSGGRRENVFLSIW